METNLQHQDRLHYAEVYVSDIWEIKNLFLQKFGLNRINENFGIPFLLIKNENEIKAFASLIINENNEIDCKIYEISDFNITDKEDFNMKVKNYFKRNNSENFRNPEHLKNSIYQMVNWLDV